VTAVGGTYKVPEVAISFSGGGFSNYFAQPSYQSTAVSSYLKTFTSYSTYFNKYAADVLRLFDIVLTMCAAGPAARTRMLRRT
jgi:hypothetical protein